MIAPTAPARVVRAAPARVVVTGGMARVGAPPAPDVWATGHRYQVIVVEAVTENRLAELPSAIPERPTFMLNGIGEMSFRVPTSERGLLAMVDSSTSFDDAGELAGLVGFEVQLWRDGALYWAGVPTSLEVDMDTGMARFGCHDLGWYLTRRVFGAPEREDLLGGYGSMDSVGLPGWLRVDGAVYQDTSDRVRGVGSMRIPVGVAASRTVNVPGFRTVLPVSATAMVKLPVGCPDDLRLVRVETFVGGAVYSEVEITTDSSMDRGEWFRLPLAVAALPPGGGAVRVGLYGAFGDTLYDDVRLLKNDATSAGDGYPADLTEHAREALRSWQEGWSKGTFGFGFYRESFCNVLEVLVEPHTEHTQASDWLSRYTERADGFDWWIDHANRTFCVSRRRGVDHKDLVFHDRAILSGGWTEDDGDRSSSVIVLGDGDGVDRPEGGYLDARPLGGRLVLDHVHRPPNGTPLSALDPTAEQVWAEKSQRATTMEGVKVPADGPYSVLIPGDRIPTYARSGVLRAHSMLRVGTIAHDIETEMLEVT